MTELVFVIAWMVGWCVGGVLAVRPIHSKYPLPSWRTPDEP